MAGVGSKGNKGVKRLYEDIDDENSDSGVEPEESQAVVSEPDTENGGDRSDDGKFTFFFSLVEVYP